MGTDFLADVPSKFSERVCHIVIFSHKFWLVKQYKQIPVAIWPIVTTGS